MGALVGAVDQPARSLLTRIPPHPNPTRDHADNLQERHSQTVNYAQKTKSVQAVPCTTSSVGCQSTDWDIHDAYIGGEGDEEELGKKPKELEVGGVEKLVRTFTSALAAKDCLLDIKEASSATFSKSVGTGTDEFDDEPKAKEETNSEMIINKKKNLSIMSSTELLKSLNLMERAVQQNLYHDSHLRYRNYPSGEEALIVTADLKTSEEEVAVEDDEEGVNEELAAAAKRKDGASMSKLFTFECELSKGRAATTMSWNR